MSWLQDIFQKIKNWGDAWWLAAKSAADPMPQPISNIEKRYDQS